MATVETPGLPRAVAYNLPVEHELPPSRVEWAVDRKRAALLVHDVQDYFLDVFHPAGEPRTPLLAAIRRLRDRCDALGIPVFHTAQPGRQDPRDRGLQAHLWGPGMADPASVRITPQLAPGPHHTVLTKWRYSAFQRTTLEPMLAARGRDQLLVTGVYAHIGCLLTVADAFMRDIQPFLVADAVADFSREHHDEALAYVARTCGRVLSLDRLLEEL